VSEASVVVVGGRAAVLSSLRSLRVVLPSGEGYWTVVDEEYRVVEAADAFLRDLRFGADRAESTTKLYAGELALFLGWAAGSGRDLERAAREPRDQPRTARRTQPARTLTGNQASLRDVSSLDAHRAADPADGRDPRGSLRGRVSATA
jgi:hypothetical protein